jgi:hypothetical protein
LFTKEELSIKPSKEDGKGSASSKVFVRLEQRKPRLEAKNSPMKRSNDPRLIKNLIKIDWDKLVESDPATKHYKGKIVWGEVDSVPVCEDDLTCCAAFSYLMVPITFFPNEDFGLEKVKELKKELLGMKLNVPKNDNESQSVSVWEDYNFPLLARELDDQFRRLLGAMKWPVEITRLKLTDKALEYLFPNGYLWGFADNKTTLIGVPAPWRQVNLVLMPNSCVLAIRVSWRTKEGGGDLLNVKELARSLTWAKSKVIRPGFVRGWSFFRDKKYQEHEKKELGLDLFDAMYGEDDKDVPKCVSLDEIIAKLLNKSSEMTEDNMGSLYQYCKHHTYIQLDKLELSDFRENDPWVWRLANCQYRGEAQNDGYGMKVLRVEEEDMILCLCVHGALGIGFRANLGDFRGVFGGVLMLLAKHALAERTCLLKLTTLAGFEADKIAAAREEDFAVCRDECMKLVTQIVTRSLKTTTQDTSSRPMFRKFFHRLQKFWRIPEIKKDLEDNFWKLSRLIHLWFQDLKEKREREKREREHMKVHLLELYREFEKKAEKKEDDRKTYFELGILTVTAIFLPFNFVAGIFGMNNTSFEQTNANWSLTLGITTGVVVFCIIVVLIIYLKILRPMGRTEKKEAETYRRIARASNTWASVPDVNEVEGKSGDQLRELFLRETAQQATEQLQGEWASQFFVNEDGQWIQQKGRNHMKGKRE